MLSKEISITKEIWPGKQMIEKVEVILVCNASLELCQTVIINITFLIRAWAGLSISCVQLQFILFRQIVTQALEVISCINTFYRLELVCKFF